MNPSTPAFGPTPQRADAPLVTVITVTYNSALYIHDAIESVLAQNYANIEYIIGDDCSTDNTWEIINFYKDSRIRAYRNTSNIREYPNRNKALSMATGKYVLFIDGDDLVYPHGLSYMVTMLEGFSDCAMAVVGYECAHYIYPLKFAPEQIYKFQFFGHGFLSYSMVGNLFHTAALREIGGFPTDRISGDYYARLRICQRHNCLIIGGNPVWARPTPGQASAATATSKGRLEAYLMNRDFILDPASPLEEKERQQALYNFLRPPARQIVKDMLKLRWPRAIRLKKAIGWDWKDIMNYFSAPQDFSYMSEYNPTKLLRMEFRKNPYAHNYGKDYSPETIFIK